MTQKKNIKSLGVSTNKSGISESRDIVAKLFPLSSSDTLNAILNQDDPGRFIRSMTRVDLFWLIKKIGEEDAFPVIRLASDDQWQYILDMEIWKKDSIDLAHSVKWLSRLFKANPSRLSRWLYSHDGSLLAHFYFFRALQVEMKDADGETEFSEEFFTIDNLYYINILDKHNSDVIEQILRKLAQDDYDRFQALLMGIAGVMPAEVEEEMYRLHNVRLAEDGYLPFDEAISIYSHENPENLKPDESPYKLFLPGEESKSLVPVIPFINAEGNGFFVRSLESLSDNLFLDRLRMEFAGLCNQVFSADEMIFEDSDVLIRTCRKTSGYIGIGLECLARDDMELSVRYLKNNPLLSIFRVGFGAALELKWTAARLLKDAWSTKQGLPYEFWGENWSGVLSGILRDRPLFYDAIRDKDVYRDFESLEEIESVQTLLKRMAVIDKLLGLIFQEHGLIIDPEKDDGINFFHILFTFWGRKELNLEPGFKALSFEQVKALFKLLRKGERKSPYRMSAGMQSFIDGFMSYENNFGMETGDDLKEALLVLWRLFVDEYAAVNVSDLDYRFIKYLRVTSM